MNRTMRTLTILAASLLLIGAGVAAAKDASSGKGKGRKDADFEKEGDKWVLANDEISVWFHQTKSGKAKPMLKVFSTDADGNVSGYSFKVARLCEVAANATSCEGAFAKMKLNDADNWNTEVVEGNETLTIRMLLTDAQGTVGLVFHLDTNASAVKFDVTVANWKWKAGTPTGDVGSTVGLPGATAHRLLLEMKYEEKNDDAIDSGDAADANVTAKGGYVSWAPNATVMYGLNQTQTANVTALHDLSAEEGEGEKEGRIALRFDAPGGYKSLEYDPTLGIASAGGGSTPSSIPAAGLAAAVAAVAVASVVAVRRWR